jgi:predicted NUDIX family phosphoesterase
MSKTAHILAVDSRRMKMTGFVHTSHEVAVAALEDCGLFIGPRQILEQDDRFRQIIPYIIVTQGKDIIGYVRGASGGEARLHGKIAIGVGGHIDLPDVEKNEDGSINLGETLAEASMRELREEIKITDLGRTLDFPDPKWVGLLIDSSNEVGRVHIGIVGIVDADGEVHSLEESQEGIDSFSIADLEQNKDRLESWTALLLPHLGELIK